MVAVCVKVCEVPVTVIAPDFAPGFAVKLMITVQVLFGVQEAGVMLLTITLFGVLVTVTVTGAALPAVLVTVTVSEKVELTLVVMLVGFGVSE
jgi:hypothetical protein